MNTSKDDIYAAMMALGPQLRGFSQVALKMKNPVAVTDNHGKLVWINGAFEELTGYSFAEVLGLKPKDFLQGQDSDVAEIQKMHDALKEKDYVEASLVNYHKTGHKYHVEIQITPVFDEFGVLTNFVAIQRDISKLKGNEEELLYNLRQQELLAEIALDLNNYLDFSQSINMVLKALLQHTQASRIYIFENVDNGVACSNTYEACNEGIEPQIGNLSYLPYEYVPYWEETLKTTGVIFSENIVELPQEVRDILEPQEIKSILVFPLTVNGAFFGFIGFDECVVYKHWKKSDLELLRAISGIISNAYEREIARKNLVAKNEELNKINAELDNFVYSVSHDLRSPLLSVKGILDLVFKTAQLDEKTSKLLQSAQQSVNRLDGTIHEILDYSRNSRLGLSFESFELAPVLKAIHEDLKFSTGQQIEFTLEIDPLVAHVNTDKSRLNTVLKNVIGNAYKYMKADRMTPFIKVYGFKDEDKLLIKVADNGEGISMNHVDKVFDMFYRGSQTSSGSGLGLYICKEIIQKMNGVIGLESVEGEGTTVSMSIPLNSVNDKTS